MWLDLSPAMANGVGFVYGIVINERPKRVTIDVWWKSVCRRLAMIRWSALRK